MDRNRALEKIRQNIDRHGFHIYSIGASSTPRYLYTIGLSEQTGFELAFAGGSFFESSSAAHLIHTAAKSVAGQRSDPPARLEVEGAGGLAIKSMHSTWTDRLLLGLSDFYHGKTPPCFQLVPEADRATIDVPAMDTPFSATDQPVWQWIERPWPYSIAADAMAVTDLRALRGEKVKEAMRWEENEWELFAGPGDQIDRDDARVVPLASLIGFDPSLEVVIRFEIGKGAWRDASEASWHPWG